MKKITGKVLLPISNIPPYPALAKSWTYDVPFEIILADDDELDCDPAYFTVEKVEEFD